MSGKSSGIANFSAYREAIGAAASGKVGKVAVIHNNNKHRH
jgi:hypothetical protein